MPSVSPWTVHVMQPSSVQLREATRKPGQLRESSGNSGSSAPSVLSRELHVGMAHPVVPRQGIRSAECLFLGAEVAPHLLLAGIVDRVLVSRQVVRP